MKRMKLLSASLLLVCCSTAWAQAAKPAEPQTIGTVLHGSIGLLESELVPAADAMPEDKYSFAPTSGEFKGARTFAQQVKHVAAVNYIVGAAILGEKSPVDTAGEKGPDAITSKADILKFLKDSFAYAHKATSTIDEKNAVSPIKNPFGDEPATRLGMASVFAWHGFDHYGQMAVYLRMNGIIPPASRR